MNFFNRALKNVTRKPTKSILLMITFFLIGNLVIIGLGIAQASESAKVLTRQKMRAVITYSIDYDAVWKYADSIEDEDERVEFYNNYPQIKLADVEVLLKDERVKTANATSNSQFYKSSVSSLDYVHLNNEAEKNMDDYEDQMIIYEKEEAVNAVYRYVQPSFFVKTNFFPNMIEFIDGEYELVEGNFYSQEDIDKANNVVVVSKALAEANGLKIGDEITVCTSSPSELNWIKDEGIEMTEEDITSTFEIIGLFDHNHKITPDNSNFDWTYPADNPDNMFFMPTTTYYASTLRYQQIQFDHYANMWPDDEYYQEANRPSMDNIEMQLYMNDVVILINDPLEVENFVEDYSQNLPRFMKLDANNDEFNKLAKPLDTLNLYANFIVWLVVINAIVIITLVTALTLKTREYEIGVLLSIGASKLKIIAQFFVELALVAIIGFTLAVGTGSLIANKVGNTVLEYQIQDSDLKDEDDYYVDDYYWPGDSNYTTEVSLEDLISEYNVSVSPLIIAEIYVVGLGIVFISVIIPAFMIMRFNPKRILMNQN